LALDRQSIEKRDFPFGRRGYEPAAVDAHLAAVAREVEALKRAQGTELAAPTAAPVPNASLASAASAQVQAIVEAAESSAAAIERDAQEHAAQSAQDAAREAQRIRDEAIARAEEHVGNVHDATALMLQRVDAMESELNSLVEAVRTGADRLNADLSLLSGNMRELYDAAGRPSADTPPAAPIIEDVAIVEEAAGLEVEVEVEPEQAEQVEPAAVPGAGAADDEELEGARLIALNMALNGQSRAETDRYLAENFVLSDRAALLDEVYATVEG
jgi:hypothetical protein